MKKIKMAIITIIIIIMVIIIGFRGCTPDQVQIYVNLYARPHNITFHSNTKRSADSHCFYFRNSLSEKGKYYYDIISGFYGNELLLHHFYNVESSDIKEMNQAKKAYLLDYPEFSIWNPALIRNYVFFGLNGINFYIMSANNTNIKEYYSQISEINEVIAPLISEVNSIQDKAQKYQYIHDWLVTNVQYDNAAADTCIELSGKIPSYYLNSFNIYGAIVKHLAVCSGLSEAYKYICDKCNLECISVPGNVNSTLQYENIGHQWNLVLISDKWYVVDVTWDLDQPPEQSLAYFLIEDLSQDGRTPYFEGVPGY